MVISEDSIMIIHQIYISVRESYFLITWPARQLEILIYNLIFLILFLDMTSYQI